MKKVMMAACAGFLLFALTAEANPGKGKGKGHAYAYGIQKNQNKHAAKQQAKMYKEQQKDNTITIISTIVHAVRIFPSLSCWFLAVEPMHHYLLSYLL